MKKNNIRGLNIAGSTFFIFAIIGGFIQSILLIIASVFTQPAFSSTPAIQILFYMIAPFLGGILPLIYCVMMLIQAIRKKQLRIASAIVVWLQTIMLIFCAVLYALLVLILVALLLSGASAGEYMSPATVIPAVQMILLGASVTFIGLAHFMVAAVLTVQCTKKKKPFAKKIRFICVVPTLFMICGYVLSIIGSWSTYFMNSIVYGIGIINILSYNFTYIMLSLAASMSVMIPTTIAFTIFCCSVYKFQKIREEEKVQAEQINESVFEEVSEAREQ